MNKNLLKIITGLILFSMTIAPVQAGVIDWLKTAPEVATNDAGSSFVFANPGLGITNFLKPENANGDSAIATGQGGFVIANNSPASAAAEKQPEKIREIIVSATAYSSTPDQTDDSPFITAWNTRVRDGIVAANFLPFGTKIKIPDIYGNKIFVVEDRMNRRYWHKVDIWFPDRQSALEFGLRTIKIQILES